MSDVITLLLGIACAAAGGELFVRGSVGLAHWLRVAPGIIGATVAAFATSSPELSVAVMSSWDGTPEISLGDALGSNVVNIALILGLALLLGDLRAPRDDVKRDLPVAALVPVIVGLLALDGTLSRLDGALLWLCFAAWLTVVTLEARRQRSAADRVLGAAGGGSALLNAVAGLALLIVAGRLIVAGAKGMAADYGVGEFIIGALVVAVGTSVPELATTVVSRLRRHDEIGLGTVLGSNIFNGLFIIAVAAMIHPIRIDVHPVYVALGFGLLTTAFTFPRRDGVISRRRGALLLAAYVVFLGVTAQLDGPA
jgi:cation:H+ antiporter